ncbi:TssA family type VI secretion system protein [Martelella mangrovi]|uniref:Type VI secretion system protein VasJ n=1 Tax=Martelella mangrovi TaxID=1397477 RepID=A0ABV2ICX9_9HYPH
MANEGFLNAINATLADPCDGDIEELPAYDVIGDALIRRGTPSQASVDWQEVEEAASRLLARNAKDIRLIEAICMARFATRDREGLFVCLDGLNAFLALPKSLRRPEKKAQFQSVLTRLLGFLLKDGPPGPAGILAEELTANLRLLGGNDELQEAGQSRVISGFLDRLAHDADGEAGDHGASAKARPEPNSQTNGKTAEARQVEPPPSTTVDFRLLRRQTGELADLLFDLDPAAPVSYLLRRHVTWLDVTAPPPLKEGQNTIVPPVSIESVERYETTLRDNPDDPALAKRLERTLQSLPFWIGGHVIAARLAQKCGRSAAATVIAAETRHFLARLPGLADLNFLDGQPLVPADDRAALDQLAGHTGQAAPTNGNEISQERYGVEMPTLECMAADPAKASEWDQNYRQAPSPRMRAFLELATLEMLAASGFTAITADQAIRLERAAEGASVREWDPELFRRLEKFGKWCTPTF